MYLDNLKITIMYFTAQWNIINIHTYTHTHNSTHIRSKTYELASINRNATHQKWTACLNIP